jgi:predicted RNA-binding Zn ribbon-like protein
LNFLCLEFINSNSQWNIDHEPYHDPIQDEKWIHDFLTKWQLTFTPLLTEQQLKEFILLRSLLYKSLNALCNGDEISETNLREINRYLSLAKLNSKLIRENKKYKIISNPVVKDWNYVLSSITASFAQLISGPEINRIRECDNPECKWFFYDESKNSSRRWCCNTCASLMKVRRFRQLKRSQDKI